MSDPNPTQTHASTPPPPPAEPSRGGPGALLWILLLLIIIALIWYFVGRRDATELPPDAGTPIGETTPVPSDSPVSTGPATRERTPAERTAPAPADRDARAVTQPAPEYPAAALRSGEEGTVIVRVDVDANGNPTNVDVAQSSRSRDLDRAALSAVRKWTFQPAMQDGKAVASTVQVPVDFKVDAQ